MKKKTLILFTGPSTAGKTTFVQLLMNIDRDLFPMVQSSCRNPRPDDDKRFIRLYKPEDYEKQDFWIRSKQYGIINKDIKTFLATNKPLSIGIVGVRELIAAKDMQQNDLDIKVALIRMSTNPLEEEGLVVENISKFFLNPEIRIEQNKRHIKEFFINDLFLKKYVDVILPRNMPLIERIHLFGDTFNDSKCKSVKTNEIDELHGRLKARSIYKGVVR